MRLAWRLDTPAGLVAMFSVGFLIRVLIAPYIGFYGDLRLFRIWASRLGEVGPHSFYVQGQFSDYPPGYLYVLWLIGKLSATPGYLLLKLPAILADLGLAWIAATLAVRIAPTSLKERLPVRALVVAAVLFNPAVIALSAVWGQVDAVPALFVLSSLLLLFTGPRSLRREIAAFMLFAVAIAMKPQSGFVLPSCSTPYTGDTCTAARGRSSSTVRSGSPRRRCSRSTSGPSREFRSASGH